MRFRRGISARGGPSGVLAVLALALAPALALHEARASSPARLLPDVVADPPDNVSIGVSEESPTGQPMEAELLLRFDGYVHNVGPGALDFRGSRGAPDPNEPASPPMNVHQRVYDSDGTYTEEPSKGEMIYVNADGHHHWHLQHVAYYSLWNAQKTAEVAPAQKVGFCLEDSERVEETGPEESVYTDSEKSPFGSREFCRQYQPEATSVFEGISEGWRDVYTSDLAFQWVDVSDVLPGEYWLRAEADPEHLIQQTGAPKPPAYAEQPTIVPGFDAQAQTRGVEVDHPVTLTLSAQRWEGQAPDEQPSQSPEYVIVTPPRHGTLGSVTLGRVRYTPESGYSGTDSFTFAARDPSSSFPRSPATATVSLDVSDEPLAPSVAIEGAPTSMIAGTSVQLSAVVSNDTPTVQWNASAGTITQGGLYTAPAAVPAANPVTISASSPDGGYDQRSIEILPVPVAQPRPEVPQPPAPSPGAIPGNPKARPSTSGGPLSKPVAMLIDRKLYMTAVVKQPGRLRLTAIARGRRVGSCVTTLRRRQSFTCSIGLARGVSAHTPIEVWATLKIGKRLVQTVRRAAPVPSAMKAMLAASGAVQWRGLKQASRFFCEM